MSVRRWTEIERDLPTQTIADAMRILADKTDTADGVEGAAIRQAADRLELQDLILQHIKTMMESVK